MGVHPTCQHVSVDWTDSQSICFLRWSPGGSHRLFSSEVGVAFWKRGKWYSVASLLYSPNRGHSKSFSTDKIFVHNLFTVLYFKISGLSLWHFFFLKCLYLLKQRLGWLLPCLWALWVVCVVLALWSTGLHTANLICVWPFSGTSKSPTMGGICRIHAWITVCSTNQFIKLQFS